jgi:hypothetical protein
MAFKFSMTRPAGGAQERRNAYIDQAAQLLQPQGQLVGSQTGVAFQGPSFDQGAQQLQGFVGNYDQQAKQSVDDARWQIQNAPMLQRASAFGGIPESVWDQAHVAPPQVQIKSMDPTLMQRGMGDPASKVLELMNKQMRDFPGTTPEQALSYAKTVMQYDPEMAGKMEISKSKGRKMGEAQALSQGDVGKALNDAAYNQQMAKENAKLAGMGAQIGQGLFGKKEAQIQGEKTKGAKDRATEQLQRDIDLAEAKRIRQGQLEELRAKLRAGNPNAHDNAIQAAMNRAEHQMLEEFGGEWTAAKIKEDPSGFRKERERQANEYMKSFGRVKARATNQDLGSSLRDAVQGYINR